MLSCESIYLTEYILLNLLTVFMTHPSRQAPYAGFAHKFMSNRAKVATFHFALSIGGSHRCDSNKLSCTYNSQPQDDAFKEIAPTRCLLRAALQHDFSHITTTEFRNNSNNCLPANEIMAHCLLSETFA